MSFPPPRAPDARAALGRRAEELVAALLVERGFVVLGRNVRVARDELDIIARRGDVLVVCEVRSRSSRELVDPIETIDRRKQARIRRATAQWLSAQRWSVLEVRFDAASVLMIDGEPQITYYEAAFE